MSGCVLAGNTNVRSLQRCTSMVGRSCAKSALPKRWHDVHACQPAPFAAAGDDELCSGAFSVSPVDQPFTSWQLAQPR